MRAFSRRIASRALATAGLGDSEPAREVPPSREGSGVQSRVFRPAGRVVNVLFRALKRGRPAQAMLDIVDSSLGRRGGFAGIEFSLATFLSAGKFARRTPVLQHRHADTRSGVPAYSTNNPFQGLRHFFIGRFRYPVFNFHRHKSAGPCRDRRFQLGQKRVGVLVRCRSPLCCLAVPLGAVLVESR